MTAEKLSNKLKSAHKSLKLFNFAMNDGNYTLVHFAMVLYDVFHLQLHFIRNARSLRIFIAIIAARTFMCGKMSELLNDNKF